VPVTLIATSGVDAGDAGLASGLLNTSQQVGGALGLAILSTLATRETTGVIQELGAAPSRDQQVSALLDGFHVAFLGGALLMAAGAVIMAVMLRRSDVEEIATDEPVSVAA
jgi:hypothetical protein